MGRRRSGACVCIPYRCGIAAFGQKGYLCGKHHGMMKITSAGFAFSSGRLSQIPDDGLPEFAFIGRSNVGKSSLINMLTDNGSLAKVSATPGKTKTDKSFPDKRAVVSRRFARLRVCESLQERPEGIRESLITDYVTKGKKMWFLFVLVDSRHAPMPIDLDFMRMLGREGVPFGVVFTKCDKALRRAGECQYWPLRKEAAGGVEEPAARFPYLVGETFGAGGDSRLHRGVPAACGRTVKVS